MSSIRNKSKEHPGHPFPRTPLSQAKDGSAQEETGIVFLRLRMIDLVQGRPVPGPTARAEREAAEPLDASPATPESQV